MANRKKLTAFVLDQKHKGIVEIRDTESPLVLRVQDGRSSLTVRTRLHGRSIRVTWPQGALIDNIHDARQWAQRVVANAKAGVDPRQKPIEAVERAEMAKELRFENVVQTYISRRVRGEKQNRSADHIERVFAVYVTPRWKERSIRDITRANVHSLLDDISDGKVRRRDGKMLGSPVVAAYAFANLRALFRWYEGRDDKFSNPIMSGLTRARLPARDRFLKDEELRALWAALPSQGMFGQLVKALLLTGQRREEVAQMARSEIDNNGVWTIPKERYKTGKPNILPLTSKIIALLDGLDQIDESDFVFTLNGKVPFNSFSKGKRLLDEAMLGELQKTDREAELQPWRLHDLRRTAKTLMARAGVRPDISERVLGDVIGGVEGVYDRHGYLDEKRRALEALGRMLEQIVKPPAENVVALAVARREGRLRMGADRPARLR